MRHYKRAITKNILKYLRYYNIYQVVYHPHF